MLTKAASSRARLLVIEDADDAREMLKFLLEIKGYVVDTAPDGYEGIALALARSPAVAVMDIGLPGMDGWKRCDNATTRVRRPHSTDCVYELGSR